MAFLYKEMTGKDKRQLEAHLKSCPACATQVATWRGSMKALDSWTVGPARANAVTFIPMLKWAAAALVVLSLGFALGRRGATQGNEMAALKASVAQLTHMVQNQSAGGSNVVAQAADAANRETARLLAEFSRAQEGQHTEDQHRISLALQALGNRVARLDSDLKTVAVNTEAGFEQTHENLTRVASFTVAAKN